MGLKPIDLEKLEAQTGNIYESIVVASKKAREINDDIRIEFKKRLEEIPVKKESDDQEEIENPEQVKLSKEFDKLGKPTEIALKALMNGEIKYTYKQ